MDIAAFRASLESVKPPEVSPPLRALWHAANADWKRAHEIVQGGEGPDAAWVHAYLHRVEGDLSNADYWYRRAGKPASRAALNDEWAAIVATLLAG